MKVRNKESGQIIDIVYVETRLDTDGPHDYYAEKGTEYGSGRLLWKDTQLDFNICNQSDFDWSSFRREAAKDVLPAMINWRRINKAGTNLLISKEEAVKLAIEYADELIRQLKQE